MINYIAIKDCEDAGGEHTWQGLTRFMAPRGRGYCWCFICGAIGVKLPLSDGGFEISVTRRIKMLSHTGESS